MRKFHGKSSNHFNLSGNRTNTVAYLGADLHAFQRAYPVFSRRKQKEVCITLIRQLFCYFKVVPY